MITEKIIQQVSEILVQIKGNNKIVVGIEGYSGTGKSTLLKKLSEKNTDILPVHRDDFLIDRDEWRLLFEASQDKPNAMEYKSINIRALHSFVTEYKESDAIHTYMLRGDESSNNISGKLNTQCTYDFSKRIMVIEGVFLYHPGFFDDIFDYRIYLDVDQEKADERRRKREMEKWGDQYFPDTHPDSYFKIFKTAYNNYLLRDLPREKSDLVIRVD